MTNDLPPTPPRTFDAVADPAQRTVYRRATARVLVLDENGRLLLFRDSDPNTAATWWITPGGGIDPGETPLEAAVRELAEETGQVVAAADVLGPLGSRHVTHGYSDRIVDQDDTFYAVRLPAFEVSTAGYTEEERVTMLDHRWWSRNAIASTSEVIWPAELATLATAADDPSSWPVPLPDAEESSVPVT